MKVIPSKTQWNKWTLISKATYFGVVVTVFGLLLTIIIYVVTLCTGPTKEDQEIIKQDHTQIKEGQEIMKRDLDQLLERSAQTKPQNPSEQEVETDLEMELKSAFAKKKKRALDEY